MFFFKTCLSHSYEERQGERIDREGADEKETGIPCIFWFIPKRAAMTTTGPGQSQDYPEVQVSQHFSLLSQAHQKGIGWEQE